LKADKIITQEEFVSRADISGELFQQLLKNELIFPRGTAEGNMFVFKEDELKRVNEIKKFLEMGYSIDEVVKIAKKIGLPSARKDRSDSKKIKYLTVGGLADKLGLNPRTIKYWEERGIIEPDTRSGGGFRLYSEHWIYLGHLIQDLQLFGFSLDEIKEIADLFRTFLMIQNDIQSFAIDETASKLTLMQQRIQEFYDKINKFKEGISRWEDLLKKKEKEIRDINNKLKQQKPKQNDKKGKK